jgi:hypothetical protein
MEASRPRSGNESGKVGVGDVVNETFSTYRDNFGALVGSALLIFVVVGIASGLLAGGGLILGLLGFVVTLIGQAIYVGFVVNLVEDVRDGRRDHGVADLFSAAQPAIPALIGFGILFAIGVGVGFLLLIVPGLFLITMWSVGAPAIVVERIGSIDAFGRSWNLVKGDGFSVFLALLVILIIVIAIQVVLAAIGAAIGLGGQIVASIVSNVLTAPIFAIAVSVMYFDLAGGGSRIAVEPIPPADPAAP